MDLVQGQLQHLFLSLLQGWPYLISLSILKEALDCARQSDTYITNYQFPTYTTHEGVLLAGRSSTQERLLADPRNP